MDPRLAPAASSCPPALGRYHVIAPIGRGGMARVYLGVLRNAFANKVVVLKHLRPDLAEDGDFAAMFVDESRVALRLNHPNVIHAYEASADAGQYYLAMEFLEGKTLDEILGKVGRRRMPLHLHLWILAQVLKGLRYAHELSDFDGSPLGIVHRDVTPSNVLVTRDGEVKLLDFGIAKLVGALAQTQRGMLKGKVGYASPEQCRGQTVDVRADVYSMGVMLWEAIAGCRRAAGETHLAALHARLQNVEADLAAVQPETPLELVHMTRKALAHAPEDRYPNVAALQHDLERYLSRMGWGDFKQETSKLVESKFHDDLLRVRRLAEGQVRLAPGGSSRSDLAIEDPAPISRPATCASVISRVRYATQRARASDSPVRQWQQIRASLGLIALTMTTIMGTFAWTASRWTARGAPAEHKVFDELAAMHASATRLASLREGDDPNASAAGVLADSTARKASPLAPPQPRQIPVPGGSHARTNEAPAPGARARATQPRAIEPGDDLPASTRSSLARGLDEGYP